MATACEEADEEAAIAIAENEGLVAEGEIVEEVGAGALEEGAEGEVFGEAVDAGDAVEVRLGGVVGRRQVRIQGFLHCATLRSRLRGLGGLRSRLLATTYRRNGRKRRGVRRTRSAMARRLMGERRRR